jgi:hypothetical protein
VAAHRYIASGRSIDTGRPPSPTSDLLLSALLSPPPILFTGRKFIVRRRDVLFPIKFIYRRHARYSSHPFSASKPASGRESTKFASRLNNRGRSAIITAARKGPRAVFLSRARFDRRHIRARGDLALSCRARELRKKGNLQAKLIFGKYNILQ